MCHRKNPKRRDVIEILKTSAPKEIETGGRVALMLARESESKSKDPEISRGGSTTLLDPLAKGEWREKVFSQCAAEAQIRVEAETGRGGGGQKLGRRVS